MNWVHHLPRLWLAVGAVGLLTAMQVSIGVVLNGQRDVAAAGPPTATPTARPPGLLLIREIGGPKATPAPPASPVPLAEPPATKDEAAPAGPEPSAEVSPAPAAAEPAPAPPTEEPSVSPAASAPVAPARPALSVRDLYAPLSSYAEEARVVGEPAPARAAAP